MKRIIGIPSDGPNLTDPISAHFGHCRYFVGVELDENDIKKVFSLENNGHSSCMEPVMNMKQKNVTDMIVGGIGGRPFLGFSQYGIHLFKGIEGSIKQNIELYLEGKLEPLNEPLCGGHSEGHIH
ncbi:MAG: dinitrogenase iron-molybdenum cofactor biosynthesis protein [Candidatus Lokiarchaeota archaeon]|nr:dinitrogenase iron-molybdenum cofactor biosynthesis protein [Candidatus Lokiarchaeota archaeon]